MPVGTYRVEDGAGLAIGTERFRCATTPAGWRYVAEIEASEPEPHREVVDLVVDGDARPVRCRIETGAHELIVAAAGDALMGVRDGEDVSLPWGPDMHLDYLSPCFNAATAAQLDATTEIEVVYLDPVTIADRVVRQRYELLGPDRVETAVGTFAATAWRYTSLPSGWNRVLWVADPIVVRYESVFELVEYEPGASGPFPG